MVWRMKATHLPPSPTAKCNCGTYDDDPPDICMPITTIATTTAIKPMIITGLLGALQATGNSSPRKLIRPCQTRLSQPVRRAKCNLPANSGVCSTWSTKKDTTVPEPFESFNKHHWLLYLIPIVVALPLHLPPLPSPLSPLPPPSAYLHGLSRAACHHPHCPRYRPAPRGVRAAGRR